MVLDPSMPARRLLVVSAASDDDCDEDGPDGLATRLLRPGLEVVSGHPLRVIAHAERLAAELPRLAGYRCVALTSRRAAEVLGDAAGADGRHASALASAVFATLAGRSGQALATVLGRLPDIVAEGGGAALAAAILRQAPPGGPVLFLRAAESREELPAALAVAGVIVEHRVAYETVVDALEVERICTAARSRPFHAIACGSPRGAFALADAGLDFAGARVGAIGSTTARSLAARGIRVDVVASRPAWPTLCEELIARL